MNTYIVPDWVWNGAARVINWFRPHEKPDVVVLSRALVLGPSKGQERRRAIVEQALETTVSTVQSLDAAAVALDMNIDAELRSIVGKAYAARKRAAHDIFVKTSIEE